MDAVNTVANASRMAALPANKSQFNIDVQGVQDGTFSVVSFESDCCAISESYSFNIILRSEYEVDAGAVLGARLRLEMCWETQPLYVHGVVAKYKASGCGPNDYISEIVLVSPLYVLDQNYQSRVFLDKNIQQIVSQVWESAGLAKGELKFTLRNTYPAREITVQYQETDLGFISRQMSHYGLFFVFNQNEEHAILHVYDDVQDMPVMDGASEVVYRAQGGEVRDVESVQRLDHEVSQLSDTVRVRDYNYRTPESLLDAVGRRRSSVKGVGVEYRYGDHFKTLDEGVELARVRQEALDWQRDTYLAESDCRGMAPGHHFTLSGHPENHLNGDYLILSVQHTVNQATLQSYGEARQGPTYRNTLRLIRSGISYRSPNLDAPQVKGTLVARVETTGGEYAYLDDQGRYHVRMGFDRGDVPPGEASHPVRLMQTYSGNNYGMHFPLHAGTEVALSFVNGDIDRPMLLGALHNPETPSPVTSSNPSQNILRTWGGNELLMEDRKGEERVELFTRDKKNIISLDANANGHKVRLATEEGDMEIYAAKTMLMESGSSQTVQIGKDHVVVVENAQRLMTKNKEISMQAATDLRMKAGDNIQLLAEKKNVEMDAGQDLLMQSGNDMSVDVENGDLSMRITNGKMGLKAAKDITFIGQGGGTIHVGQSGGSIEISAGGDLIVSGPTVTISGGSISIKGSNVGNN